MEKMGNLTCTGGMLCAYHVTVMLEDIHLAHGARPVLQEPRVDAHLVEFVPVVIQCKQRCEISENITERAILYHNCVSLYDAHDSF